MQTERERLLGALDHIAKTAALSRTSTRRLRWIEARARGALDGRPYSDMDIDLPKDGGPNTVEKLSKRIAYLRHQRADMLEALSKIEKWNSHTSEFAVDFGSNGVRDLYRGIASDAIHKVTQEMNHEPA